jgi:hypothetical protein
MDILKEYTLDEKFKEHLRFFTSCRMADFYFPCHPERSEGSHFLTFFEKERKKSRFFAGCRMTLWIILLLS